MLQVRQCETQLNEADARLKQTREKLDDADENLRMATAGFREGVVASSVLDLARTAWLQAHSDYIDAKTALWQLLISAKPPASSQNEILNPKF